ncbi:MAG: DNA-3-methyladenine glycosylase family protein [Solirubrobacteraceae bacterium]
MPDLFEIIPRGPFSLRAATEFGFGPNAGHPAAYAGLMRLAFPLDGGSGYVGAVLRQAEPDDPIRIELELHGASDPGIAVAQIARIVSLDYDGEEFLEVAERDPVIGALQRLHPGQRPVLFHSPYEGAAWSVISARRPGAQAARVRSAISAQLGATFELAGETLHAFPQPGRLLELGHDTPWLSPEKVERLRGVALAAAAGKLDVGHLRLIGPERAYEEIQQLKGIGPFYGGLVVLRASGFADAMLEVDEAKVLRHAARFYGLDSPPTIERFAAMAERWRPFRTWAIVLIRLAGDRGTVLEGC